MEQYPFAIPTELRKGLRNIADDLENTGFDAGCGDGLPTFRLPNMRVVEKVYSVNRWKRELRKRLTIILLKRKTCCQL